MNTSSPIAPECPTQYEGALIPASCDQNLVSCFARWIQLSYDEASDTFNSPEGVTVYMPDPFAPLNEIIPPFLAVNLRLNITDIAEYAILSRSYNGLDLRYKLLQYPIRQQTRSAIQSSHASDTTSCRVFIPNERKASHDIRDQCRFIFRRIFLPNDVTKLERQMYLCIIIHSLYFRYCKFCGTCQLWGCWARTVVDLSNEWIFSMFR